MRAHASAFRCLFALLLLPLPALAAPASTIPLDDHGLPQWEVRVWRDFPVRIGLESREALQSLLAQVPIAGFDREQVRPDGLGGFVVETRVTDEEARDLTAAGRAFERLPDLERATRQEMEETWRRQAEEGKVGLRAGVYHTYAQIGTILQSAETAHPSIADRMSLGTSVQGRELWTLKISDNVGTEEAEPEVRLAGTIHGNEPPAQEMLLYLVDWLTSQYGIDPVVTELVDETEIFITPCLNPDGLTAGTRRNSHNVDLNRNYPVPDGTIGDDGTWTEEPETAAVRAFGAAHDFVVSMNGHTGVIVVNYPWDYQYPLAPDDAAIIRLSLEYSTYNLPMYNGDWPQGITNGAAWYVVKGSLQDWSYAQTGCIDVTVELSNSFAPPASQLDTLWNDNRESFLHYVKAARYGVHGHVTSSATGLPLDATVTVTGNAKPVFTDPDHGNYYKLLPTGTFTLTFTAAGHIPRTVPGVATTWGTPTVLDVELDPIGTGVDALASTDGAGLVSSPNPFRDRTNLRFEVQRPGRVRVAIHDAGGRRVRLLVDEPFTAGPHALVWDGRSGDGRRLPAGVYFARLAGCDGVTARKLELVR